MQLPGEQVNTEVTVLACGRRGRDANDLAGTSLKHHEVTNANVVARDGNCVGQIRLAFTAARARGRSRSRAFVDIHFNVVMASGMDNLVCKLVHAVAERVVVA